jgi:hypothetical protein
MIALERHSFAGMTLLGYIPNKLKIVTKCILFTKLSVPLSANRLHHQRLQNVPCQQTMTMTDHGPRDWWLHRFPGNRSAKNELSQANNRKFANKEPAHIQLHSKTI